MSFYVYQFEKHIFSKDWGSGVETAAYVTKTTGFLIMTVFLSEKTNFKEHVSRDFSPFPRNYIREVKSILQLFIKRF